MNTSETGPSRSEDDPRAKDSLKKSLVEGESDDRETYSPISLPRISFMSDEPGTGGHARSSADTDSPQMSLFGDDGGDRP
jgi:hypothetical protein